jgi:hypothetical protein
MILNLAQARQMSLIVCLTSAVAGGNQSALVAVKAMNAIRAVSEPGFGVLKR